MHLLLQKAIISILIEFEYKGNDKALIGKIKNILKRSGFEGTKEERALEAEHLVRVRRVFLNMNKENTLFRLKKKDSKYISNTINVVNRRTIISLASKKDANDYKKGGANKYVKDAIYIDESGDVQLLKEKRLRKNKRAELQAVKELKHERAVVKHFPRTGFIRPKMTLGRADGKKSVFEERFKGDLSSTKKLFRLMMAETSVQKAIVIKSILYQLAEALKSLHEKGYVHRDIKPANILYKIIINPESETPTIEVVFTDFAQSSRNYEAKGKPGTTFYCSPGQLANGQNARGSWTHPHLAKSDDVYSLGVAMHELLEGSGLMRGVNIQGARLSRQIAKMLNVPEFQDSTSYNPFIEQVRNRNAITQVEKMNAFVNLYKSFKPEYGKKYRSS